METTNITPAALSVAIKKTSIFDASKAQDNFAAAVTPGGIEKQEVEGQQTFVANETLPRECPRKELEAMGIVFGENADDLFVNVTLPDGWKKVPTDHSMRSELKDANGTVVASIFYKAAFYDRSAFMSLAQ